MNNKLLPLFFAITLFVGCTSNNTRVPAPSNDTECIIIGNISNLSNCKLELRDEFDGFAVIARSKSKQGKFIIKTDASVPTHVYLYTNKGEQLRDFYLEPGTIYIDGDCEDIFKGATGTITNDYEQKVKSEVSSLSGNAIDSLSRAYAKNAPTDIYVLNHINNIVGWTSKEKIDIINGMDEDIKAKLGIAELLDLFKQRSKVECQSPYIDIIQPNADGVNVSLREIVEKNGNKYVLLDFWATWCSPCREETPLIKSLYEQYHGLGFDIYACSLDNGQLMEQWKQYIKDNELVWTNVCDGEFTSSQAYKDYALRGIPDNVLIDCSTGLIVARSLRGETLKDKLSELFN